MSSILVQIKRAVIAGNYEFSEKARMEMERDALTELDVAESIVNAHAIDKTIRSINPFSGKRERLYIIKSFNLTGVSIYTKGKLVHDPAGDRFYFLISSKNCE